MSEAHTEQLSRADRVELFLIQTCGTIAAAFLHSGVVPTNEDWAAMKGEVDPTMRQIGEIGHRTGYNMHMQLISPRTGGPDAE